MLSARSAALAKLLSKFGEGDDEMLMKNSPKAVSLDMVKAEPAEGEGAEPGLTPELLMKLLESLKGSGTPDGAALKEEAVMEDAGGDPMKMAEGGMVLDSLADKRANQRMDEQEGAVHLAKGGEVTGMGNRICRGCGKDSASCRCDKMAEGGLVEDGNEGLSGAQMRRRDEQREMDKAQNASDDMDELAGESKRMPKAKVATRKSRYWKG